MAVWRRGGWEEVEEGVRAESDRERDKERERESLKEHVRALVREAMANRIGRGGVLGGE